MDFYVDSALLCMTVMNYVTLDVSRRVMKLKRGRVILSSVLLSALSLGLILTGACKIAFLPFYIAAVYFAFGKCSFAELVRRFFIVTGCAILLGGIYLAILNPKTLEVVCIHGRSFYTAEDFVFYGSVAAVYLLARVILFFLCERRKRYRIRISIGGKQTRTYASLDTGNGLRMPDGKEPVILAEQSLFGDDLDCGRKIPCRTAASGISVITVYPVDELYFEDSGKLWQSRVFAGKSNREFSGGCKVLLNSCMEFI